MDNKVGAGAILLLWSRSVKLSQNCEIASGLPCYAHRHAPRNDAMNHVIASVAKQSQIHTT
jgi:hypothetical protein